MGIRGLTTFIQSRSHLYMDRFELHDTNFVIDGNAVACQLYRWHCTYANDCFGGDYDKYGKVILDFFQLLFDCNITPYVVFDGGYESKKVATVITRMKNKISTAAALDSVSEGSYSVFPLFLRDCFEEVLTKLGIKKVRCDYEGDSETANMARALNCPVLSYDSDFFIFDVLYIPFKTFEMKTKVKKINDTCYKYIPCEVYRIDKFLNSYGGMDKGNLPILAVLLGNDYVRRSVFALFFQNLKIQKCQKNQNEQQRRIKSLIIWLQNETKETAIKKVLSRYKKANRQKVFKKIQNAIQGYYCSNSNYLSYIGIEDKLIEKNNQIDFTEVFEEDIEDNQESTAEVFEEIESDNDISSSEETEEHLIKEIPRVPSIFLEKFRKCSYPPCFMDIISHGRCYCIPQVENIALNHSHIISLDILSAIHQILTNSNDSLTCLTRIQNIEVGKVIVPKCIKIVPYFVEVDSLSEKERINILLNILNIPKNFNLSVLTLYPKSWSLFIISIYYFYHQSEQVFTLIYAFVLSKIILEHIDQKIGFYRNKKSFDKKFSNELKVNSGKSTSNIMREHNTAEVFSEILYSDCLSAMSKLLIYFEMEEKMRTHRRSFNRNLVHSISQFQSCLLHIKYLNCLLNYPYSDICISETLNCTFIYNFTNNLKKRTNIDNYLEVLLGENHTILSAIKIVVSNIKDHCPDVSISNGSTKKRKKKKKTINTEIEREDPTEESFDDENLIDTNNKFSLLGVSQ